MIDKGKKRNKKKKKDWLIKACSWGFLYFTLIKGNKITIIIINSKTLQERSELETVSDGIRNGIILFQKGSFLNFRNGICVSVSNFCDGKILFLNIATE